MVINSNGHEILIDDADASCVVCFKWRAVKTKRGIYYAMARVDGHIAYLHRFIMGASADQEIDHIDGNPLNNTRRNLRICPNHSYNNANNKKRIVKNQTSAFKGVRKHHGGKWQAFVMKNGKFYHLGIFAKEPDAALAYNVKATELFGEFARINDLSNYNTMQPQI